MTAALVPHYQMDHSRGCAYCESGPDLTEQRRKVKDQISFALKGARAIAFDQDEAALCHEINEALNLLADL